MKKQVGLSSLVLECFRSLKLEPNNSDRVGIPKIVRQYSDEEVCVVLRWSRGDSKQACWLRGANDEKKNYARTGTLWRPDNFPKYLDAAGDSGKPESFALAKGGDYQRRADDVLPALPEVNDDLPF